MLSRSQVKRVLDCPSKPLLILALELVNLKEKERVAIEYVDIKGYTEEQTAEILNISRSSITKYRKNAYNKMGKVWEKEKSIKTILEG